MKYTCYDVHDPQRHIRQRKADIKDHVLYDSFMRTKTGQSTEIERSFLVVELVTIGINCKHG